MAKYRYTDDGLLDPACLTPEMLYAIQSNTWVQGAKAERERIIKLLEAEQLHDPDVVECHCGSWREAVALIKGEK